jgi:hypothetical protein
MQKSTVIRLMRERFNRNTITRWGRDRPGGYEATKFYLDKNHDRKTQRRNHKAMLQEELRYHDADLHADHLEAVQQELDEWYDDSGYYSDENQYLWDHNSYDENDRYDPEQEDDNGCFYYKGGCFYSNGASDYFGEVHLLRFGQ